MMESMGAQDLEIDWWGQLVWREMMHILNYGAFQKCLGAVAGARRESSSKIAAVESVELIA